MTTVSKTTNNAPVRCECGGFRCGAHDGVAAGRVRRDTAIDALGAVEVAPGYYAWVLNEGATRRRYVVATADALRTTNEATNEPDNRGVLMPAWWLPDDQTVIRVTTPEGEELYYLSMHDALKDWRSERCERITASLETGEEIPA